MRLLLVVLVVSASATGVAEAQTPGPAVSGTATATPAGVAAVMKHGRIVVRKGAQLVSMTADMPLANGSTLQPDGTLLMPHGQQLPLSNGEVAKTSGTVMPGPHPAERRMTRFNKRGAAGMMRPPR